MASGKMAKVFANMFLGFKGKYKNKSKNLANLLWFDFSKYAHFVFVGYYKDIEGMKLVGAKMRELRKGKGFSQEQLANLCELPLSQISRIETGAINTSISHIFLIARNLGVHPREFFNVEFPSPKNS